MCKTTTSAPGDSIAYVGVGGCVWCNGVHAGLCPWVLEIEYRDDGGIKRVLFVPPNERGPVISQVEIEADPLPYDHVGHVCGKDCPQTVW